MRKLLIALLSLALTSSVGAQSCCDARVANPPGFTWAGKPTCSSSQTGRQIRITDVGGWDGTTYQGSDWTCNGTRWSPSSGGPIVLYERTGVSAHTGTTSETVLGSTVTIPAGMLGANGGLVFENLITSITNSANNKTIRHRWGASSGASCTGNTQLSAETRTTVTVQQGMFWAQNTATNAQIYISGISSSSPFVAGTQTVTTAALDTTAATYVCFTAELANSGETLTPSKLRIVAYIGN